ncbi:hypothetical protein HMN09_00871300 [Mycena chlorophos]|uniref:Zn(2)-C6 fungal-type domain-containing protein n=1 Tax=Mycena chlorophos TaxID=658473 RepID=A0A8H6SN14_MYCCL|nr:hypothetical protein HMN09_00871300 [Mycena chlorophos]
MEPLPKLKTATCTRCKRRKIRCDGQTPCKTCEKMQIECQYEGRSGGKLPVPELKRGAACLQCRRKKKRCDGKLPCNTCQLSRSKVQCEYGDLEPQDAQPQASSSSSGSSANSPATPDRDVIMSEPQTRDPAVADATSWAENPHGAIEDISDKGLIIPPATSKDSPYDITITHVLSFPQPPPEEELGGIRKLFLEYHTQFGLNLSDTLLTAVAEGDLESKLHPVLLHACQLLGFMLAQHRPVADGEWVALPGPCQGEVEQAQATLSVLQSKENSLCPFAYVQTSALLSLYFFNKGDTARAREMISRADRLIREHSLDTCMIPSSPPPPKHGFRIRPDSYTSEGIASIAQIVYLDLSYAILLNEPSLIDSRLLGRFREQISAPNPHGEVNFVRAKSLVLFFEVRTMVMQWVSGGLSDDCKEAWLERYWDLIDALHSHKAFIALILTRIAFCPTLWPVNMTLKVAQILVLTGLATLLSVFERDNRELMNKKHEAIAEIVQMSNLFEQHDYAHLDPILSACWFSIINTLEQCTAALETILQAPGHPKSAGDFYDTAAMTTILRTQNAALKKVLPGVLDLSVAS